MVVAAEADDVVGIGDRPHARDLASCRSSHVLGHPGHSHMTPRFDGELSAQRQALLDHDFGPLGGPPSDRRALHSRQGLVPASRYRSRATSVFTSGSAHWLGEKPSLGTVGCACRAEAASSRVPCCGCWPLSDCCGFHARRCCAPRSGRCGPVSVDRLVAVSGPAVVPVGDGPVGGGGGGRSPLVLIAMWSTLGAGCKRRRYRPGRGRRRANVPYSA